MKKVLHNLTLVLGFVFLLGGILLYGLGKYAIIDIAGLTKLPWVVIILGIGFIVGGACEVFITTSKEMQIEAKDERNIVIGKTAKAFGFDIMTSLFSTVLIVLVLFDLITTIGFFALFAVFVIAEVSFIFKLWVLQKKM